LAQVERASRTGDFAASSLASANDEKPMSRLNREIRALLDDAIVAGEAITLQACCDFEYLGPQGFPLTARFGEKVAVSKDSLITLIAVELKFPFPTLPFSIVEPSLRLRLAPIIRQAFS